MVNELAVKGYQALVTYYGHPQRAQRIIALNPMVDADRSRNALAPRTSHLAPRKENRQQPIIADIHPMK